MTKRYKIWFWVNVGVLVLILIYGFLVRFKILIIPDIPEIFFPTNAVFFISMLQLIINSRKSKTRFKLLSILILFLTTGLTFFLENTFTLIACTLALLLFVFMFKRASYFYVLPAIIFGVFFNMFFIDFGHYILGYSILIIAIIPLIEILTSFNKKTKPKQYALLTTPINIGIIFFTTSLAISILKIFSFNSSSIFITGSVTYSITLLYIFLSLPKSNYIDWPKDWKIRFLHYEIIPALIFLIIMVISLTMDNFFNLFKNDIYAAYEIDFNRAIQILQ